jgi:hypothetical protein
MARFPYKINSGRQFCIRALVASPLRSTSNEIIPRRGNITASLKIFFSKLFSTELDEFAAESRVLQENLS